jgi:signal recognition particle subunit SRP19
MGARRMRTAVPKGDRPIVLYPAYFDVGRSRDEGRRVAKKVAVESPTVQEVASAARALGLEPKVEEDRAFPATPWKKDGRVLVRADFFKTSVVRKVAERIKASR